MRQPSEEEIRALEAEMAKLTVDDVVLQTIVTLINLGARKAGLADDSEPDLPQVKKAIDAARALLPIVEGEHGEALAPVRQALSQLQMAYVQKSGARPEPAAPETPSAEQPASGEPPTSGEKPSADEPGPAQKSGRLWVPGR
jgi:hypothetical protein